jgi:hypothetical protein
MKYLDAFSSSEHAIYNQANVDEFEAQLRRSRLLRQVKCQRFFLENRDAFPVRRTMERYYFHPIEALIANDLDRQGTLNSLKNMKNHAAYSDWEQKAANWINPPIDVNAPFFVVNSHLDAGEFGTGISAPNFLCEFSNAGDRLYCAEIQRNSIRTLLESIDCTNLGNGRDIGVHPTFLWGLAPTGKELGLRDYYLPGFGIRYDAKDYESAAVDWILNAENYRFLAYRAST